MLHKRQLGAVLLRGTIGKDERPVAYVSRTLNNAEENYSSTEKELLAMVYGIMHFRPYLGENTSRSLAITDHYAG